MPPAGDKDRELETVKQILQNNGYNARAIINTMKKTEKPPQGLRKRAKHKVG
jgi:hypothetical protein